jgi:hypothetical protein
MSHAELQQVGSIVHTALQHVASEHAPVECTAKHEPLAEPHVPGVPGQRKLAYCAQFTSQAVAQQYGSVAHTLLQHVALLHAGLLWLE